MITIILAVLFGSYRILEVVAEVLFSIALFILFPECGVQRWWALVPFARVYFLGKCADRKPEGKAVALLDAVRAVALVLHAFVQENTLMYYLLAALSTASITISIVYRIRIYSGICEVYHAGFWWLLLWFTFPFIPAAVWGYSKKYEPAWTVDEIEADNAARLSGNYISDMNKGLTVNLEERTLRKLFEKKYLLRDIHVVIPPGHMVLLLGGSGAGKTTLINAINGYEKAKASVVLNGNNVYTEFKDIQYDIGYVPQKDMMRDNDTVLRTLYDAATLRMPLDADRTVRKKQTEEVLDIFGLGPVKNSLVDKLSGGQRKRLSIAMEYLSNPALFILDEPDSGLDGVIARKLMEHLRTIADQGKIVIVITHTPDRVVDLFDDVIVLAKDSNRTGRVAFFGSIEEARSFFGRDKMEEIVMCINQKDEGGEGRADEFITKYMEVQHA